MAPHHLSPPYITRPAFPSPHVSRAAQSEIADLKDEQQQEKEDLLHAVRELTRQLQLQNIVIENFIPKDEVEKLERRARWDEV